MHAKFTPHCMIFKNNVSLQTYDVRICKVQPMLHMQHSCSFISYLRKLNSLACLHCPIQHCKKVIAPHTFLQGFLLLFDMLKHFTSPKKISHLVQLTSRNTKGCFQVMILFVRLFFNLRVINHIIFVHQGWQFHKPLGLIMVI